MSTTASPTEKIQEKADSIRTRIDALHTEIEALLDIGDDLDIEILRFPKIFSKLSRYWDTAVTELSVAEQEFRMIHQHLMRHYSGSLSSEHYKVNPLRFAVPKTEVGNYVKVDPLYMAVERYKDIATLHTKILEDAKKACVDRSHTIRTAIEFRKFVAVGK